MANLPSEISFPLEIAKLISQSVIFFKTRSIQTKEDIWTQVNEALDQLETLVKGHLDLIDKAIAPVIGEEPNGVLTTAGRFRALVFNHDLPIGYQNAVGYIDSMTYLKEFKWETIAGRRLDTLRKELPIFQYAVFPMLSRSGYLGDYGFGSAAKLWSLVSSNSPYQEEKKANLLQEEIRENFRLGFEWLLYEEEWLTSHREEAVKLPVAREQFEPLLEVSNLHKPDGIVELVRSWCVGWQYLVKQQTWGKYLSYAISQLRLAKFK